MIEKHIAADHIVAVGECPALVVVDGRSFPCQRGEHPPSRHKHMENGVELLWYHGTGRSDNDPKAGE